MNAIKNIAILLLFSASAGFGAVCKMPDSSLLDLGKYTGASAFYEKGIYGQNVNVANLELYLPDSDPDYAFKFLEGVEYKSYYPSEVAYPSPSIHPAQTLSVMAGYCPDYADQNISTGLAYKANFTAAQVGEASILGSSDRLVLDTYQKFFTNSTEVISSSWKDAGTRGHLVGEVLDTYARQNPTVVFVAAASNDADEGPGFVNSPYKNMNVIKVGALDDKTNFSTVASTSSYGPNDFYNPQTKTVIKGVVSAVDISTAGTVYTLNYNGELQNISGTSFAAPIVSSVATLMLSYSKESNMPASSRDARLVKAILLNSASKLDSWDNGSKMMDSVELDGKNYSNVLSTNQSLDYYTGAGALNASQALKEYEKFGETSFLESVAASDSDFYYFSTDSESATLNATLCWFVGAQVGDVTYDTSGNISELDDALSYFANLDLRLWYEGENGERELIAQSVSEYNNVEHLYLTLEKEGNYALEVYFKDLIYGSADGETYALAWNLSQVPEPAFFAAISGLIAAGLCIAKKRRATFSLRK